MQLIQTLILWCLAFSVFAGEFVAGKDYQVLPRPAESVQATTQGVEVVEFFSYGCPWCYRFEPHLERWLAKQKGRVNFQRVPVIFHEPWGVYARAYYTVMALGIEKKVNLAIFKAIQEENKTLTSVESLAEFVSQYGVSKKDFSTAFLHSPSIDIYQNKGLALMRRYQITGVPCVVVAGRYKTDSRMAGGDVKRLLAIVDHLIQLSKT